MTNNLTNLVAKLEDFKACPYPDEEGIPTIGYGCTYYSDGKKVTLKDRAITKDDALTMLETTLLKFRSEVLSLVKIPLEDYRIDALTSLAYNIGITDFKSSTLLKEINAKVQGADIHFLDWDKVTEDKVKVVSNGLVNRRKVERALYLHGYSVLPDHSLV